MDLKLFKKIFHFNFSIYKQHTTRIMADIDECAGQNKCGCHRNDGVCKATCTNTDGSYNCKCSKGYYKNSAELCEGMKFIHYINDLLMLRIFGSFHLSWKNFRLLKSYLGY